MPSVKIGSLVRCQRTYLSSGSPFIGLPVGSPYGNQYEKAITQGTIGIVVGKLYTDAYNVLIEDYVISFSANYLWPVDEYILESYEEAK